MDHGYHQLGLSPDEIFLITSVETLKVVADPLRLQLLALLRDRPRPAKQLAAALHVPLKKLYYHLNLLEEHGLIRVVDTRVISGIIEKHYRVTAYRLSVERDLLSPQEPGEAGGLDVFLSLVLDHARAEIRRSVRAGLIDVQDLATEKGGLVLGRLWLNLTPRQAEAYSERLSELHHEFAELAPEPGDEPAQRYEMLLGWYPVLPSNEQADQDNQP
ncbi:MAG TPA: helix-turn-helix domain-containing protein [Roseiflexaceae bacterium]|nr:helix-turn-helix domain-containing protein [Roseiflexaceae bacterium]